MWNKKRILGQFHSVKYVGILMILVVALTAVGCGSYRAYKEKEEYIHANTGFKVTKAGMYDSADNNAIVIKKNVKKKSITFLNKLMNRNYTLNFDGTSKLYDKNGQAITMEQLNYGDVVNITFLKEKKLLNSLMVSDEVWAYSELKEFAIDEIAGEIKTTKGTFRFDDSLVIFDKDRRLNLVDINPVDVISITGLDRMVYSIQIDKGHGFLKLRNEDVFVGGWIEIGSKIIRRVDSNMLLAVPEGEYQVLLSNDGYEGRRSVSIDSSKETVLDVGDVEVRETATYGQVAVEAVPETAEVSIDGKIIDITQPVKVEYGIHQLIAKAAGYRTLTQYIKVGQESMTLQVELEPLKNNIITPGVSPVPSPSPVPTRDPNIAEENTDNSNESVTNDNTATDDSGSGSNDSTVVKGYKVTVATPVDAEVYLDGNYIGISPISFTKVSGTHEIILRKEGFITRSFTITIDASKQDERFSFSDMIPEKQEEDTEDEQEES